VLKIEKNGQKIYFTLCLTLISLFAFSQWTALLSPTTDDLYSIYFPNANRGYAVGYHFQVFPNKIDEF
jgi:hypothetical protein